MKPNIDLRNCAWEDMLPEYEDNHFELAIVDPPYGIDINSSGRLGHYGGEKDWDRSGIPSDNYFNKIRNISKNQIVWGGNYFSCLWEYGGRGFITWDKQQPQGVSFASCELAWTSFDKSAKTFYMRPQNMDNGRIHPTQKPVALYRWLLQNYAEPGDKILDTHMGSGSIAIACWEEGFDLTACEIDADYYESMLKRFNEHKSQQRLFA